MKRYLKLVNFEMKRFMKIYLVLLAIVLVGQIGAIIFEAKSYLNRANQAMYEESMSQTEFMSWMGSFDFMHVVESIWFFGPIALCIAGVAFYIFLIWYRDWFGKNTFIYRLLMLPTARLNVFYAKLTTILLMTLGFVAFQLLLLPVETTILKWMVPKAFRVDMSVTEIISNIGQLQVIIPHSFIEFIFSYGAGFMIVTVLFTAILFERSYRLKGILMGAGYGILAIVVIFLPSFAQDLLDGYFYIGEMILLEIVACLIVTAGSIWMSGFLLNKKIRV